MRVPPRLAAVAAALVALALTTPADAATIRVENQADELGGGDGCSLREATIAANADTTGPGDDCTQGAGTDVVALPGSSTPYTLALPGAGDAAGDLDVHSDLFLRGAGADASVIDAAGAAPR